MDAAIKFINTYYIWIIIISIFLIFTIIGYIADKKENGNTSKEKKEKLKKSVTKRKEIKKEEIKNEEKKENTSVVEDKKDMINKENEKEENKKNENQNVKESKKETRKEKKERLRKEKKEKEEEIKRKREEEKEKKRKEKENKRKKNNKKTEKKEDIKNSLEGFVEEKNYNAPIIEDFNEKPIVEDIVFNNNQKDFKEGKSIIEETKEKETLVEKKINEDFAANPIIEENKPLIEKYAPIENEEKNGNSIDDIIKTESNNIYEKETLKNPYTNNIKETKKEEILNPINVATYQEDKKPIEDIFNVGNDEDFLS